MTVYKWAMAIVALTLVSSPLDTKAEEGIQAGWFQLRGPNRDGKSTDTGLVREWGPAGPREVWRVPVGPGFSPISIVGERVYSMASDETTEYALCLDASSGETVWRVPMGPLFKDSNGDGPRSPPTVDGDRVYVLGSRGRLASLNRITGEAEWQLEFLETFDSELPTWGFSTAPLVDGELLIMEVGGSGSKSVAALENQTGKIRWTAQESNLVYSSPILIDLDGKRQYVFLLQDELVALSRSGEELWSIPFAPRSRIKPAMPLFIAPNLIMVAASYDVWVYHMVETPVPLLESFGASLKPGAKVVMVESVPEEIEQELQEVTASVDWSHLGGLAFPSHSVGGLRGWHAEVGFDHVLHTDGRLH